MSTNTPEVVQRYFASDAERDTQAILELFADDATVIDEGEERRGTGEIRRWRTGPASRYQYTTTILDGHPTGEGGYRVIARLDGNFPGGSVELKHDFRIDGDRISYLKIAP
jgi:SnoaL-like protein